MADTRVETSELNQDSLDGAQASVSEVGSAEEFEKENTNDTPSESHGEAEGDATDGANGEESREAEDATAPAAAAADANAEANGTEPVATENGDHHVNGNGKADENGEADSTEVDGAEKRKSIEGEAVISPKKARVESEEAAPEEAAAPTNGHEEAAAPTNGHEEAATA